MNRHFSPLATRLRQLLACLVWISVLQTAAATLVATNSSWRLFKGTAEPTPLRSTWRQPSFNDASWTPRQAPFSYGKNLSRGTVLSDMYGNYSTVYLRIRFNVADPSQHGFPILRAACDDGFIAYLNGREIARYNVGPGDRPFDSHLAPDHATAPAPEPSTFLDYPVGITSPLVAGENVLAVQVLNCLITSGDVLFDAELVTPVGENIPPTITAITPPPGETADLSRITVTFSEPVRGVDAGDFVINGFPATGMRTISSTTYEFSFAKLPFGRVDAGWIPDHGITDAAASPNPFQRLAPGASWSWQLINPNAPQLVSRLPAPGVVRQFSTVDLQFSEPVSGVDATDLLVNGSPALSVSGIASGPWRFTFPPITNGVASIEFAPNHGITDQDSLRNAFPGAAWSVTVKPSQPDPTLRITELLAVNATLLKDEDGDPQPWIELHNHGPTPVDLTGLGLADNPEGDGAWVFPSMALAPDQRLVVFASGKDRRLTGPGRFLHTDFKLARDGEFVGLFNAESPRRAINTLPAPYPPQRNDISWGLTSAGTWAYFQTPTPGSPNTGPRLTNACDEVRFSVERGYFNNAFELILTTSTPGAVIRYTVNGCDPNATNSLVYSGPIPILRSTSVRANALREGLLPSRTQTHTYLLGLSTAQRSLPALSIVTDTNNLTGPTGIVGMQGGTRDASNLWTRRTTNDYYNPSNRGIAWERPASVEWITTANNGEFQLDAGLRLHASDYFRPRLLPSSKFSWRLYFRGDYGSGRLQFPLIPAADVDQFDAIVCRAGSNDLNPFVRDEIMRRLLADCGQVSARGTFATLFLNGRYAGFYNPVERVEADFLSIHHGGGDAWDVMSQSGVIDGDRTNWDLLVNEIQSGNPADNNWYRSISSRLDVTNFTDYLLVNAFGYNGDWPGNNWRTARERKAGALWRHYIWDAEFALGLYDRPVSGNTFNEISGTYVGTFYARLRQHPEFRLLFADRAHRHLFNGGALTTTNILRHFSDTSRGLSGLISGFDSRLTNWVRSRTPIFYNQLVSLGLSASTNAPVLRQHGGRVPAGFALSMTNLNGDIWFTTDGSDPRVALSGLVAPFALRYNPASPPILDASVQIRARSFSSNTWSALTDASFSVGDPQPPVRISELMYQPPGGAEFEFVEIRNLTSRAVDLSGFVFEGIECRFPNNTLLPARAVWVIASDKRPASFASRYPGVTVNAWFNGSLDNAGEWIALRDADGALVDRVRYRPNDGWPTAAAGSGASIERTDFGRDANDPAAWRASALAGGSPGTVPTPTLSAPSLRIDEVFASNAGRIVRGTHTPDFAEIRNVSTSPINIAGWTLRRADRTDRLTLATTDRILPPGARFVAWFGDAAPGDVAAPFRLDSNGGVLILGNALDQDISTFAYGPQALDRSVGFIEGSADPILLDPTPGSANSAAPIAPPNRVSINEWLANPSPGTDDFIELFNADPSLPVFLPGCWIAVSNSVQVLRFPSAIAPRGFATFKATQGGQPDELPFRLPAAGNVIRWFDPAGRLLDEIRYNSAIEGVSSGRFPDGSTNIASLPSGGTPGAPNLLIPQAGPQLSEIFAASMLGDSNPDRSRDWIELVNTATTNVSIGSWRLALRDPQSRSWSVPAGVLLPPNARLRILADPTSPSSSSIQAPLNTGFGLPDSGGTLEWQDPAGIGRQRITFGPQIAGLSIGTDAGSVWNLLSEPTPARTNAPPAALAFGEQVCINEWLAAGIDQPDFIELFNPHTLPVDVSGWALTDDPSIAGIQRYKLPPLSFIDSTGWLVIHADNRPADGPTHAPFELSSRGESLRLYRSSGTSVDAATVLPTSTGITSGRFPDGSLSLAPLTRPTPGAANLLTIDADNDGLPDAWESSNSLNPSNPTDAGTDSDGDGRSNLDEFLAGTDPNNPTSVLALNAASGPETVTLSFRAEAGRTYAIQQRQSLDHGWSVLTPVTAASQPRHLSLTITTTNTLQRLYRIVTPAP